MFYHKYRKTFLNHGYILCDAAYNSLATVTFSMANKDGYHSWTTFLMATAMGLPHMATKTSRVLLSFQASHPSMTTAMELYIPDSNNDSERSRGFSKALPEGVSHEKGSNRNELAVNT